MKNVRVGTQRVTQSTNPPPQHVSEHLANERTYLAWMRTAFSLVSLGFATNRFSEFMIELRAKGQRGELPHGFFTGSERFGLGMVVLGTLLMVVAAFHYMRVSREIESGGFRPRPALILVVSLLALSFGVTGIILLMER